MPELESVEKWMSHRVLASSPADRLGDALQVMQREKVHHICVVDHGRLVGIVSDRDIKRALPSAFDASAVERYEHAVEGLTVAEIMTRDPVTVSATTSLAECAELLLGNGISAAPVVAAGRPIGIVTRSDCLAALSALTRRPRAT